MIKISETTTGSSVLIYFAVRIILPAQILAIIRIVKARCWTQILIISVKNRKVIKNEGVPESKWEASDENL